MKKTTKLAKRILSVVLALSIVLSFAISVSAFPADFDVIGDVKLYDFEDGDVSIFKKSGWSFAGSVEPTTEKVLNGEKAAKLTVNANKLIKFWPNVAFEKNSTYILSYYYYSDFTAGITTTGWNAGQFASYSLTNVPGAIGKWNKTIVKITTGDTAVTDFAMCYYNIGEGATVYIDDVEFAKVESFTGKAPTLPVGATVDAASVRDFEDGSLTIKKGYANFTDTSANKDQAVASIDVVKARGGHVAMKVQGTEANTGSATLYMIAEHTFQPTEGVVNANRQFASAGLYYMSYYAYTDAEGISTNVSLSNGYQMTSATALEAGKWTKVSGVYEVSEDFAAAANSGLFRMNFANLANNTVYVDDIYLARVAFVEPAMLYDVNAEYNSADNTAVVKATSTVALKSATNSAPAGVTASDVVISKDGTEVSFNVSGLTTNTTYELTANLSDVFGSAASSVPVNFTTPMTISASSVANGATDVLAPVDYILIDTPSPVVESTVTADKFTLEGHVFSSIAGVAVADGRIRVELDGIYGSETYTLSVDGVEATNGAILKDSITFTTRSNGYYQTFEGAKYNEETETWTIGYVSSANATTLPITPVSDVVYEGNMALAIKSCTDYIGYAKVWMNNLNLNSTYKVSFYMNSNWTGSGNVSYKQNVLDYVTIIGDYSYTETDKEGWRKFEAIVKTDKGKGGLVLNLWGVGDSNVYIDNVKLQEIGTISNPVMFNEGAIVNTIAAGTTNVILATADDMTASKAYAVQYNADGKMIQLVPATIEADAITFEVTSADVVKTKLIIMDGTSYAPVINYIQFN